ncbi:hypothetical protein Xcc3_07840 [Xanthomonas campestris pv. campestris]|nr:hypothetical protein Xcc3_07840 [Xanthomonas campestris pv. campestris]
MPVGTQMDAAGTDLAVAQVTVQERGGLITERTRGGNAVFEPQRLRIARRGAPVAVAALVVVVEAFLDVQAGQVELEVCIRLPLQCGTDAIALTRLLKQGGVDRGGKHPGIVADHGSGKAGACHIVVTEDLHTITAQHALRMHHRGEHAERFILVFPAVQRGGIGLAFFGTIVVPVAHGAGERVALQLQRLARVHDHGAADRALINARLRRLVDLHQAHHLRCQRAVVERAAVRVVGVAAPAGGGDGLAIEQHAVERRVGTEDADFFAFAELAVHGDAGEPRQRLGDVGVGEFADVFGADRIDDGIGIALDVERLAQAGLVPDNLDFVQRGHRGIGGRGVLRNCRGWRLCRRCCGLLLRKRRKRQRATHCYATDQQSADRCAQWHAPWWLPVRGGAG